MRSASATVVTGSVPPGTIGTPAAAISSRALVLEAIASIASGEGPMKTRPASAHARAKSGFSARKPKPGWMASAPARRATAMIVSARR